MKLILTPGERQSLIWRKLMEHCKVRLADLRGKNDGPLDITATSIIRGQIQEVKNLMAADQDAPRIPE